MKDDMTHDDDHDDYFAWLSTFFNTKDGLLTFRGDTLSYHQFYVLLYVSSSFRQLNHYILFPFLLLLFLLIFPFVSASVFYQSSILCLARFLYESKNDIDKEGKVKREEQIGYIEN